MGSTAMLGGGATDRDRSTENDPELDADDASCPPLGVVEVSALVRVEGGGSEGRVVVGGVDAVAGGGGMLGAFGNGVLASADGGGVLFSADGALDVVDEWMGVFSTLPVVCASGSVVGSSGAVGRPTAARSASFGALGAFGATLARSEPKSTGGSAVIEGGGIDTGFFGGAAIDGEVFGLSTGAVDAVDAVAAGVAVGAGNEPVTARRAPVVSTRPSIDGGGMLTDRVVALGDTLVVALVVVVLGVAVGVAAGVALVALLVVLVALLVVLLGAGLAVLAVLALAAVVDVVGGADVVAEVAAGVAVGGDELVALVWRAPTASGESDAAARGALGGGTRTDGDVPCAGGCSDAPFPLGGGTDVPDGFAPSSPSPTLASEGTFGAAGTAPSAGDFTGSSPGKRTAGIARLEALRARTGGALAMNTSRFSIARNGVQCCPSGDSSSAGVMRPSATHARSSPLLGRAARVPLGRRTFHGR
ncbi:MAG: hypothetical protein JNK05_40440 [Myxococcales bacterium]|nr:hypothetical protein [Myxococcales bacterium]